MIKVLYLRSSFDPGGTESLLLNLFNYPQQRIQFHFAFLRDGSLISRLQSDTNRFYRVFRQHKLDFNVIKKLSQIIRENKIEIVHSHQLFELFYAVLLKIKHPKVKLIHTIHGYHDEHSRWAEYLERFLIRFTQCTLTVSKSTRSILIQRGYPSNKIKVLYNAVKPPVPVSDDLMEKMKERIHYRESDFIVGMIGSFVWQKDQMTLIKAFNLLKDEIPELKLVIMGKESEFSERCKAALTKDDLNNRVFFLGAVENASGYLSLFDLFVMSTLMDTFGIVVIEALMSRVPVLSSDIDVMKELSHNGRFFKLFTKEDPIELSLSIKIFYENKQNNSIEDAFQYVFTNFSYEKYISKLLQIY